MSSTPNLPLIVAKVSIVPASRSSGWNNKPVDFGILPLHYCFNRLVNFCPLLRGFLRLLLRLGVAFRLPVIIMKRRLGFYLNNLRHPRIPCTLNYISRLLLKLLNIFDPHTHTTSLR